jgi:o-succinylbenzoate synthase
MTNQAATPALIELLSSARVVSLPLRTRFRGVVDREVMLFEGPNGWAEWSPFLEYPDEEAAVWLAAAIEFAFGDLPELRREAIPVNATLPAVAPDQIEKVLSRFGDFSTVKIKVAESGQNLDEDLARIAAVHAAYPDARIRLDANGGYSVEDALTIARAIVDNGIALDYLEQPVATIAEMAELRLKLAQSGIGADVAGGVKIAADESVRKVSDPMAVVQAGAADILVLKAAPLGGISRAMAIAAEAGLPVVISSALESSVGLSMGAHLAASLPIHGPVSATGATSPGGLAFDSGLGTASLLAGDITREPLLPVDGFIEVRRVEVDEQKLDVFEAEDHRIDWWIDRLDRAFKHLN